MQQSLGGQTVPPAPTVPVDPRLPGPRVGTKHIKGGYPPSVRFLTPQTGQHLNGQTVQVKVLATDESDVNDVIFFEDGRRVAAHPVAAGAKPLDIGARALTTDAKPIPAGHTMARQFTADLSLPSGGGSLKVQAVAVDDDGLQSAQEEIVLSRDTTAAPVVGKLLGLCVGISHYRNAKLDLKYADADATSLAESFNQQHDLYSATQVVALTNGQATRDAVKAALDRLSTQATPNDTVVLLLSGHGWRSDERTFYFATHEVDVSSPDTIARTALPWRDVTDRLVQLSQRSRRVIVLLDACHSGSAVSNEELVNAVLGAKAGVIVFASSRGSEVSLEGTQWQHGAFTKGMLEAVAGEGVLAGEKSMSLFDFEVYVRRRVKSLTEDQQHPQVPFLQNFDTDAALVAKHGP